MLHKLSLDGYCSIFCINKLATHYLRPPPTSLPPNPYISSNFFAPELFAISTFPPLLAFFWPVASLRKKRKKD